MEALLENGSAADDFEVAASSISSQKRQKSSADVFDENDYSVSELLVELEWNPAESTKRPLIHEDASHPTTLSRSLGEMQRKGQLCDLTLLVENGGLIPVHSCIMAAVSPILSHNLVGAAQPVQVLQLSALPGLRDLHKRALSNEPTVRNLLCNFAYFGNLEPPKEDPADMLIGGDVAAVNISISLLAGSMALQMDGAVHIAMELLKNGMNIATCLLIFAAANEVGCVELEHVAESYLDVHFSDIVLEQSWIDAPEYIINRTLRRSELCARDESECFRALSRWYLEDAEKRVAHFEAMVADPHICRLILMSDLELSILQADDLVFSLDSVKNIFVTEVNRRQTKAKIEYIVESRRFHPQNNNFDNIIAMTSLDLVQVPQSPSRTRGRAASVVLNSSMPSNRQEVFSNVTVLSGHEKPVCALAANDHWIASGSSDATIRVWEIRTWKGGVALKGHEDSVSSLRFFHDRLISGSFDRSIRTWHIATWKFHGFVAEVAHEDPVTCLMIIQHTDQLASGSAGGEIKIWSLLAHAKSNSETQDEWRPMNMLQNAHAHVLWSCCEWGSSIVTGSSDKEIRVWDSSTWTLKSRFINHSDEVQALIVIGDELFSGSDDGVIAVHSTQNQTSGPSRFAELHRPIMALAEYQSLLAVGFGDGGILLLNSSDLSKFGELKGHTASVMSLLTKNDLLISGSFDKTVRVWEHDSTLHL